MPFFASVDKSNKPHNTYIILKHKRTNAPFTNILNVTTIDTKVTYNECLFFNFVMFQKWQSPIRRCNQIGYKLI